VSIDGRANTGFLRFNQTNRQRFEGDVQVWDTRIGVASVPVGAADVGLKITIPLH